MGSENFLGHPDYLKWGCSPCKGSFTSVLPYPWVQSFWVSMESTGEFLKGSVFVFLTM